jgi:hypothetical protein
VGGTGRIGCGYARDERVGGRGGVVVLIGVTNGSKKKALFGFSRFLGSPLTIWARSCVDLLLSFAGMIFILVSKKREIILSHRNESFRYSLQVSVLRLLEYLT